MATPRRNPPRRLGEAMRRKLEVTSAMAWEALVDTHGDQATQFVGLLADFMPVEDALPRYLREMDLGETMATAIRTRVLMRVDEADVPDTPRQRALSLGRISTADDAGGEAADDGWNLLRQPQRVVRDVRRRQRRNEALDRTIQLAIARAEERVIRTHVENAIGFVALLDEHMSLDRAVQQYLGAVNLAGGRAQAVFQRTMAKLADVHLPV
ncbi:hypothetical protein BH23GEM9_BH23GEM9_10930 [soil metagenome]